MDLNELKSNWRQSGTQRKTLSDLQRMTLLNQHPQLRKIRIKLIIEVLALLAFLIIYYTAFDGNEKTFIMNALLITAVVLYLLCDFAGYLLARNPIKATDLLTSIDKLLRHLRILSTCSIITSAFFGATVILFLTSEIDFTPKKYMILAGMIATLIASMVVLAKIWKGRISNLEKTAADFR
jgi:hypothetical protein